MRKTMWIIMLLASLTLPTVQASWGYTTADQGLQLTFDSIYYKGYWYTQTDKGPNPNYLVYHSWMGIEGYKWYGPVEDLDLTASAHQFLDHVSFDVDVEDQGKPNLHVTCDSLAADQDYPARLMAEWPVVVDSYIEQYENETGVYERTVEVVKNFEIWKYRFTLAVNSYLSGTHDECYLGDAHYYLNLELWCKLEQKGFKYWMGNPDTVYFAPAYIALEQNPTWGYYEDGKLVMSDMVSMHQSIYPGAQGETVGIMYTRGGPGVDLSESEILRWQDVELDPAVFREEYWFRLSYDRFGPVSRLGPFRQDWFEKLPSVQQNFRIDVFVVGEWTVRFTRNELVELKHHETTYKETPAETFWDSLTDFGENLVNNTLSPFTTPMYYLFLLGVGCVALIIITLTVSYIKTKKVKGGS